MRNIIILTVLFILFAIPAYAASGMCSIDGPHNCNQSNEDQLVALTKNTIHNMQLTTPHAFKTNNDIVLEEMARNQAMLSNPNQNTRLVYPSR